MTSYQAKSSHGNGVTPFHLKSLDRNGVTPFHPESLDRNGVTDGAQTVVGIDLGGTNLRVGVVDLEGQIISWVEGPIEAARGPEAGLQRISALVERALDAAGPVRLGGIGIGASGPVDRQLGAIQNPHTLPTWENVDVVTPLSTRFDVPVALENDADIAVLGEYWTGAGRGCSRLAMVTVGTGIGVSVMVDGRLYRGAQGFHPEGGHIVLDPHGPLCYCGAHGCWESLASGTAIGRLAREREAARPTGLLARVNGDLARLDADLVGQAAEEGDTAAREVLEEAAYFLGLGLVNLIGLFFPEVIVLGGGVMRRFDLMLPVIEQTLARHAVMVRAPEARIEPAQLGTRAGVVGAAYAALHELE